MSESRKQPLIDGMLRRLGTYQPGSRVYHLAAAGLARMSYAELGALDAMLFPAAPPKPEPVVIDLMERLKASLAEDGGE